MPPKKRPEDVYRESIERGLRQSINTWETLRRYEDHYERLRPRLSADQQFYMDAQFARHESKLMETTRLGPRPSEEQIKLQSNQAFTYKSPAIPNNPPTGHGETKRKRTQSEEELMSTETLDFNDLFPPPPPPPPPPSAGGAGIFA